MVSLDMNQLIEEAVAPLRAGFQKRGIPLRIECSEGFAPVWGDPIQLQQVIFNLARNGAEAMGSADGSKELLVTCRRLADDSVLVAVRDSGAGVHPEYVERIFDPFFTTKDAGMGMGLSISRSIIEAHGGRIWAELNQGPGLTVQFSVPPFAAREPRARNDSAARGKVLRRKSSGPVNRARHQSISRTH